MKIDVRELNELVNENITALTKEHETLSDAMTATTTFTTETQAFFKGKTADASRAYLQEAYLPVQQKTLEVNELMTKTLTAYIADAQAQFGANGIVDIPAIEMEYKRNLNQLTDYERQEYRELNDLIQEANEFISFPTTNLSLLEELQHDALAEITKIRMKLEDFETKWNAEFSKVESLQDELDRMLAQIESNKITPTGYQAGTFQFVSPIKSPDEFDSLQEYYKYVTEWAVTNGKAKVITVDGQTYYEFIDTFYWVNYGHEEKNGTMIMTEVNGEMIMFLQREHEHAISVPFGTFYPDPFQVLGNSGWQPLPKNGTLVDMESPDTIKLYHWKSSDLPEGFTTSNDDLKAMADFYAGTYNSYDASVAILKYLAHDQNPEKISFTNAELDEVATNWSGGHDRFEFAGEVEAHADMLVDDFILGNLAKSEFAKGQRKIEPVPSDEQIDTIYYHAASIADMAKGENGDMNNHFNSIWGNMQKILYAKRINEAVEHRMHLPFS
ncbi:hypothetical protein HB943_03450 [Listeria weihenstephanensis]|uniref:LXG domain-containing protein n=1 Tax=Listeria weihenstephanensis TaxID=1006155 RepID=A0A841Z5P0_9LIST|nr:T7SS effector LXG polymorphic toxin [Listeria weihenstephanensis]MBC1499646.1 hypothetical protein [Listeria weihenstephanensis]